MPLSTISINLVSNKYLVVKAVTLFPGQALHIVEYDYKV